VSTNSFDVVTVRATVVVEEGEEEGGGGGTADDESSFSEPEPKPEPEPSSSATAAAASNARRANRLIMDCCGQTRMLLWFSREKSDTFSLFFSFFFPQKGKKEMAGT
jgi:hypothetical protein